VPINRTAVLAAVLTAVSSIGAAAVVAAGPARAATPAVEITKVYYDSPGKDDRSNTSLNAEYVRLTNRRDRTINLDNWTVRDRTGYVYTFVGDVPLAAGATLYLHTGQGTDTTRHRYWNRRAYVWNNTGDKAILRNASGVLKDTCTWGDGAGYTLCR